MNARPVFPEIDEMLTIGAAAARAELGQGGLGHQDHALHVDRHHAVELRLGQLLERAPGQDAGVVHDDVEPAQAGHGLPDHPAGIGGLGDVAGDAERADAAPLDAPDGGLEVGRLREPVSDGAVVRHAEVDRGDVNALAREGERRSRARCRGRLR